jgi:hypothetical protein
MSRPHRTVRSRQFLPPQHGAWAMLVVPFLAGVVASGVSWIELPLLGAWLAGYPLSYYAFQTVKARRAQRYETQLAVYSGLTLPLAAVVVWWRPAVLWYAPVFAALIIVNFWYAWRRRERALVNDIASVVQSCLMVLVVTTVDGRTLGAPSAVAFVACLAYFTGVALYVKTMIRERDVPAYRYASVAYHAAVLALALGFAVLGRGNGTWFVVLAAWLLLRAIRLPTRRLTPKHVGLIEMGNCVALLAAIWLALH